MLPSSPDLTFGFALILIRASAMLVSAPLFSNRAIPSWTKVGFCIFLALIVAPLASDSLPPAPPTAAGLVGPALREILFGLAMGLAMQLVFISLQMGSQILGLQIGYGLGAVFDPTTGSQFGPFDQFYSVLATLLFFVVNGHHLVITAFAETVQAVPPGSFDPFALTGDGIAALATGLLVTAVRIAMPVLVAIFLTDVGMGFVAKTAPQANLLVVGAPVKIGVGIIMVMASLPVTVYLMRVGMEGPLTGASATLLGVR